MNYEDFCILGDNQDTFYCKTVELIGPVPKEFEFFYGISYLIVIIFIICIPLFICKILGGAK